MSDKGDAAMAEASDAVTGKDTRLSVTSERYDLQGKGYLDPAESEMRKYDTSERGFLTSEKVIKIVEEKLETEKKASSYKKLMIFFGVLSVLLAVSNIGTAYLAVSLQKDTETDSDAHLITTDGGEIVKVEGVGHTLTINQFFVDEGYACVSPSLVGSLYNSLLAGTTSSLSFQDEDISLVTYGVSRDGVTANSTHLCMPGMSGNREFCVLFEDDRCGGNEDSGADRRHLFASSMAERHLDSHRFLKGEEERPCDCDYTPRQPMPSCCQNVPLTCFSAESTAELKNGQQVKMKDLQIGDEVLVDSGKYQPVYSFGHNHADALGDFFQLYTTETSRPLELSGNHLVFRHGEDIPVCASSLKIGDMLASASNKEQGSKVTKISKVKRQGLYAPLTTDGTIAVNGIVASNYIGLEGVPHIAIGDFNTGFESHGMAHLLLAPYHVYCAIVGCENETYNDDGFSTWSAFCVKVGLFTTVTLKDHHVLQFFVFYSQLVPLYFFHGLALLLDKFGLSVVLTAIALGFGIVALSKGISIKWSARKEKLV